MPRPTALLFALALFALPALAQGEREASPGPNWVFQPGAFYGQISIVDPAQDDALFPININNNWGLMNQEGHIIHLPEYDWTDYGYDGLARYMAGAKTGYISGNGSVVIRAQYDYADRFVDGLAVVMIEDRWGMIDRNNDVVIPLEYTGVLRFQDGFAAVQRGELCGFIDRRGRLAVPLQFKAVRSFHNGFAAVQLPDGRWGYIDKRGELVWHDETGRVTMLGDFHEQYARVRARMNNDTEVWGYLTKAFRWRIEPAYEDARDFHNGMAAVKVDGRWGFVYANGRWAIEPQFEAADDFDDAVGTNDFEEPSDRDRRAQSGRRSGRELQTTGLYAMVKQDGRWGYVNRAANGGLVPQFETAEPFYLGLARVARGDSFAYIGETGQVIFDPESAREGLINRTTQERARQDTQRNTAPRQNSIESAPPPREAADHPYLPEHLYEEALPRPER
ncbi:MAG: WG repeat-containing protein [Phycisphaerales bacterium JB063]